MGSTPFFIIYMPFPHFARKLTTICKRSILTTFNMLLEIYPLGIRMYSFEICIPFEDVATPNM